VGYEPIQKADRQVGEVMLSDLLHESHKSTGKAMIG
jgi:hypothetical protein